jgi:hypothetical protein
MKSTIFVLLKAACLIFFLNTTACSFFEKLYDFKDDNVDSVDKPLTLENNAPDGGVFYFDESAMSNVPSEVIEAAETHFETYRKRESGLHFTLLGIDDKSEIEKATLGIPYEILYIPAEYVETDDEVPNMKYGKMLIWAFPLIIDGKYKALYKIAKHKGEWKWVELGASMGARLIRKMEIKENIEGQAKKRCFVNYYQSDIGYIGYADTDKEIEQGSFYTSLNDKLEEKIDGVDDVVDEIKENSISLGN